MIFDKQNTLKAVNLAFRSFDHYMHEMYMNPYMSYDDKMKTLQWIYQKIPQINRLLIQLKTEEINKK